MRGFNFTIYVMHSEHSVRTSTLLPVSTVYRYSIPSTAQYLVEGRRITLPSDDRPFAHVIQNKEAANIGACCTGSQRLLLPRGKYYGHAASRPNSSRSWDRGGGGGSYEGKVCTERALARPAERNEESVGEAALGCLSCECGVDVQTVVICCGKAVNNLQGRVRL